MSTQAVIASPYLNPSARMRRLVSLEQREPSDRPAVPVVSFARRAFRTLIAEPLSLPAASVDVVPTWIVYPQDAGTASAGTHDELKGALQAAAAAVSGPWPANVLDLIDGAVAPSERRLLLISEESAPAHSIQMIRSGDLLLSAPGQRWRVSSLAPPRTPTRHTAQAARGEPGVRQRLRHWLLEQAVEAAAPAADSVGSGDIADGVRLLGRQRITLARLFSRWPVAQPAAGLKFDQIALALYALICTLFGVISLLHGTLFATLNAALLATMAWRAMYRCRPRLSPWRATLSPAAAARLMSWWCRPLRWAGYALALSYLFAQVLGLEGLPGTAIALLAVHAMLALSWLLFLKGAAKPLWAISTLGLLQFSLAMLSLLS